MSETTAIYRLIFIAGSRLLHDNLKNILYNKVCYKIGFILINSTYTV